MKLGKPSRKLMGETNFEILHNRKRGRRAQSFPQNWKESGRPGTELEFISQSQIWGTSICNWRKALPGSGWEDRSWAYLLLFCIFHLFSSIFSCTALATGTSKQRNINRTQQQNILQCQQSPYVFIYIFTFLCALKWQWLCSPSLSKCGAHSFMGFETKKACEIIRSNTLQTQSSFHPVMSPSEAASQLGWHERHGESGAGWFKNPRPARCGRGQGCRQLCKHMKTSLCH